MLINRRRAKAVKIGNICIGADNPVAIQSMVKAETSDIERSSGQIERLQRAGCEIVRLAVKDMADAAALKKIKIRAKIPVVADIHFDWRLAIEAIDSGADKIRLNPGNIYRKEEIKEIARAAKSAGIPIRVGVNSGSLRRGKGQGLRGKSQAAIMVDSAVEYIRILEKFKFHDIVVSLKASNILDTVEAYRRLAGMCDYPLHLGVTATGPSYAGALKSSIALGALLLEGIGDTIRISLTDTPEQEVKAARAILEALGLRNFGPEIISCPTCGRCEVDLIKLVNEFEDRLSAVNCELLTDNSRPLRVAIMGCVVNGPGEAREADIGLAFGRKEALLFKSGRAVRKVSGPDCADYLLREAKSQLKTYSDSRDYKSRLQRLRH